MDRFYAGTAENIEAEYGAQAPNGEAFVLLQTWNDEPVTVEGFNTVEQLKAALAPAQRAVELNPGDANARTALQRLQAMIDRIK